jgi:hypothetical protein
VQPGHRLVGTAADGALASPAQQTDGRVDGLVDIPANRVEQRKVAAEQLYAERCAGV